MDKKMIVIEKNDGSTLEVEAITYLISEDNQNHYIVYSKGELSGTEGDEVIYISKITRDSETLKIQEITDDTEWKDVQQLLKKIANS